MILATKAFKPFHVENIQWIGNNRMGEPNTVEKKLHYMLCYISFKSPQRPFVGPIAT